MSVVPVADGSAIAKGIQTFGAGLQQAGTTALRADLAYREEANQLNTAVATVELNKGLLAAKDIPSTDGDYTTYKPRYEEATKQALEASSALISDPTAREKFRLQAQAQIDTGANFIGDQIRTKDKDTRLAALNNTLDEAAKQAVDKRLTSEDHDALIANIDNTIKAEVTSGRLTAVEGQDKAQRFMASYAFNRRLAAREADPLGKATPRLAYDRQEDPSAAITPQARQVLAPRLASDKDAAQHVDKMKPRFANNLASMFEAAPPEIKSGLGVLSGARSRERQQQLWDASDKSGRTVGTPDGSRHVAGDAADLSFNGMKLDDKRVPQGVRDWVRENAPKHGLGLPMAYEPWHIEDFEARAPDSRFGAKVREAVAGARPDLMAASSINRAKVFPAITPQEFFGPGVNVASLPAGLRNNNPGNIKYVRGSALPGITGPSENTDQGDPQAVFSSPQAGATAAAQLALRKFDGGKTTVREIIAAKGGWTPGNNAAAQNIAKYAGLDPDQPLDLRKDPTQLPKLMRGIFMQEQGDQHAKYDDGILTAAAGAALGGEPIKFISSGRGGSSNGSARETSGASASRYVDRPDPIMFDTDRFLTPTQRIQLDQMAEADAKEAQSALRVQIADATENAPAAIQNGGAYTGAVPDRETFVDAFGEAEGMKRYDVFQADMQVAQTARDFQTKSSAEINQALQAASPANSMGNSAALDQKRSEALQKAAASVLKARAEDPAGYVMQAMPNVRAAWEGAQPGTVEFSRALRMTTEAQRALGIANVTPLPKAMAAGIVETFDKADVAMDQRMAGLASAVFATKDPDQQRGIYQQLVKAGLPPIVEGALEAAAREGVDSGAARRLMFAATVDPDKIPGKVATKDADIRQSIQDRLMAPGKIGDVAYGLSLGNGRNVERPINDSELMLRAVKVRLGKGEALNAAVDGVARDVFGDKEVFSPTWGLNGQILVDKDYDTASLRRGLEALTPRVKDAVTGFARAQIDRIAPSVPANSGARAVLENNIANRVTDIMATGTWHNLGSGLGFLDAYTGQFVTGVDGKPLTFSFDEANEAGRARDRRSAMPTQQFMSATGEYVEPGN